MDIGGGFIQVLRCLQLGFESGFRGLWRISLFLALRLFKDVSCIISFESGFSGF